MAALCRRAAWGGMQKEIHSVLYLRATAYLRGGNAAAAAQEYQKIVDSRFAELGWPGLSALTPLAKVGLARAYALQGKTADARTAYQDFFALWKDADPDIPILRQAKAEYTKLRYIAARWAEFVRP